MNKERIKIGNRDVVKIIDNCPLNHKDCFYNYSLKRKRLICENYRTCENLALAWEIPYIYSEIDNIPTLIVKSTGYVTRWEKVSCSPNGKVIVCYLPSGYYIEQNSNYHDDEMKFRIVNAWKIEGWAAAVDSKVLLKNEDIENIFETIS